MNRCKWCTQDKLYMDYHDNEWGVPVFDDRLLFEFLILEGSQAGLSWITILKKRENYQKAFDNFDFYKIAGYSDKKIDKLTNNPGIIRHKLKIRSAVTNAQAAIKIIEKYGSLSSYLWRYVDGKPIQNNWKSIEEVPTNTKLSDQMSKDLKKDGFKFIGSTICYSFMQAVGMVNDHTTDCFRYEEVKNIKIF